jgi:hypothetical protein
MIKITIEGFEQEPETLEVAEFVLSARDERKGYFRLKTRESFLGYTAAKALAMFSKRSIKEQEGDAQ